ncbi:hypothetical protein [Enterobacillus tribolii]|uniref:Uncharacterized protein n=1 Tax=Enterobacillus tribolii TaxID=1487935 RepID=A0A370R4Z2_9GAMM|nr:hypothetical protein [Enterobacillus tribolii]MBW7983436.1 hypothetical protein [Enterobacillus tribolii]RDK97494.1 hypothetical protein C8D90_101944 [Enterobacillus tribolii]
MQQFNFSVTDIFPEITWEDGELKIKLNEQYSRDSQVRQLKVGLIAQTSFPTGYPTVAFNRTGAQFHHFGSNYLPETVGDFQDMIDQDNPGGDNTLSLPTPLDTGSPVTNRAVWLKVFIYSPNDKDFMDMPYEQISGDYGFIVP